MKRTMVMAAAGAAAGIAALAWWRRHPRFGTQTMNRVVDPWLVRQGVSEVTHGEIALLEHVGRVSGIVRLTPVHAVDTADGVRIIVPLGVASEWGKNVLTAGRCRLQRGETILELDTPQLVDPLALEDLPRPAARAMSWLGFRYLLLRRFEEHPGTLTGEVHSERSTEPQQPAEATPVG